MDIFNLSEMKGGWYVGDFSPSAFSTDQFEVGYKIHPKGDIWDLHYHERITEINLLVRGEMIMQGKKLFSGDIFIIYPYEIANPEFLEDCEILCVKTPGIAKDKIVIEKK